MHLPHSKPDISKEDIDLVTLQVSSGMHATGSKTQEFEDKIREFIGTRYAKATSSGTTALHLALMALDVSEGDEVIIPSYVCQSLLNAVNYTRAKPVFADIDSDFENKGYNISAQTIKLVITEKTKAIIVPHMFGMPADIEEILKFGIPVIEDCAQAIGGEYKGKKLGSIGDIGVFSFYATKVISTGQGGMVVTDLKTPIINLGDLTQYDKREDYEIAYNYGLSDIQSALGISQFNKLPEFIKRRNKIADKYDKAFKDVFKISKRTPGSFPFRYIIRLNSKQERENLQIQLNEKNIIAEKPVFKPLHQYFNLNSNQFKNTELAHDTTLSIPIYPAMTDKEVDYVIENVLDSFKKN